ncbi:MAG: Trk system potassium transporter TrkA [Clostridia bacterium]|nr:Trk system potassium transporter TrkA [Clostridia bacterium]
MKIIVVGCGKIGATIIESLVAEGHDVTAVDNNSSVVNDMVEMYDCIGVCGSGTDCNILSETGVETCELFVAVTGSDEFNMLACFMAKSLGAKHTIARIRNPEYNDRNLGFIRQNLGLSMAINPELLAAKEMFSVLQLPSATKVEKFSRRNFEMVEIVVKKDSPIDGMSLIDMRKKYTAKFLVCAVEREDEVFVPDGNFILKTGDKISITASPFETAKLLKSIGLDVKQSKNVMILGATKTSYYLAKMLVTAGTAVKVIDPNKERCEQFSEVLPDAVIINGDVAAQQVLIEEGIKSMDAFVSLTGVDEENILMSLFASSQNVPKVISKINRDEFNALAEQIGIETIVSPRHIIADVLVRYARGLQNSMGSKMETLYKLMDGKAEVLEFLIESDCKIADKPLKELNLKKNTLIAGIIRARKTIIPTGDDKILASDTVIVLAAGQRINDISDIIK